MLIYTSIIMHTSERIKKRGFKANGKEEYI